MGSENLTVWPCLKGRESCAGRGDLFYDARVVSPGTLSSVLSDRYRCPDFNLDLVREVSFSPHEGYFRLGSNAICYGHCASRVATPARASSPLYDVLTDVRIENETFSLPFDPSEIIDNLRLERYATRRSLANGAHDVLRRLYYLVRPVMNTKMRRSIQKFHARNWQNLSFPQWPVDTTVENIFETLLLLSMKAKGIDAVPFVWFWPDGAPGCFMMTHDVEAQDGLDNCMSLMDIDDSFGIKASINIVPEGRYDVSPQFLEAIKSRGFDIGIQDLNHDGRLFDSREEFVRRARLINTYAADYGAEGFRAAVLYRNPDWYRELNFAFDMSMPNVAHLDPQQGGCCTVMPYFIGSILELPTTTVQDYTLFYLLNQTSSDLWKEQVNLILEKRGLASFIVHPDYIREPDTLRVYRELLEQLNELHDQQNVWFALPTDVNHWWRARSRMGVQWDGESWRIKGDNTGHAVLAYARNVNDTLVYELETDSGKA
jgi:hypothetical protein